MVRWTKVMRTAIPGGSTIFVSAGSDRDLNRLGQNIAPPVARSTQLRTIQLYDLESYLGLW